MDSYDGNILVMPDAAGVAEEAAGRFACAAVKYAADTGRFTVAVPGGSSPVGVFERLTSPEYSSIVPWQVTHIFFTDERCVPPDHPDSNYRLVHEHLLSKVPIPEQNIHRFMAELPADEAAADYEKALRSTLGDDLSLDMIILGMGEDTHTASLFPNSPALNETDRLAAPNYVEKLGSNRLTLTYPMINSSKQIIIVALGQNKAGAVREAISGEQDPIKHPIQGVRPVYGRLLWLIDRDAARNIAVR